MTATQCSQTGRLYPETVVDQAALVAGPGSDAFWSAHMVARCAGHAPPGFPAAYFAARTVPCDQFLDDAGKPCETPGEWWPCCRCGRPEPIPVTVNLRAFRAEHGITGGHVVCEACHDAGWEAAIWSSACCEFHVLSPIERTG